jgi:murein DD-endopeptidase MepM/ murein hydrolase activator NlpD
VPGVSRRTTAKSFLLAVAVPSALVASAPAAVAAAPPSNGGASADPVPVVEAIACRARCEGSYVRAGSGIAISGDGLGDAATVTFVGTRSAGDEVSAAPRRASEHRVMVTVPAGAVRGPVVVADADGTASKPSKAPVKVLRPVTPKSTGGPIATAVTGRKAFFDGARRPTLTYFLATDGPAVVTVTVVGADDGRLVATFDQGSVDPGQTRTVSWDGLAAGGRAAAPEGRYAFVVTAADADSGALASTASAGEVSADDFVLLGHRFPIRGRHDYGGAIAAFGGGRGHQGHDIFAKCGTPLVAARGGVVKMKRFQARAGNYLVIDNAADDVDAAYMHLREPALVEKGDRVRTGQLIGHVGDTGEADGCHLHFEEWTGPGWYTGGSPFDPLPDLKAWDAVS